MHPVSFQLDVSACCLSLSFHIHPPAIRIVQLFRVGLQVVVVLLTHAGTKPGQHKHTHILGRRAGGGGVWVPLRSTGPIPLTLDAHTVLLGGDIGGGKEREGRGKGRKGAVHIEFQLLVVVVWVVWDHRPPPARRQDGGAVSRRGRVRVAVQRSGGRGREGGKERQSKGWWGAVGLCVWPAGKGVQRDGVGPQIPGGGDGNQMGKAAERTAKKGGGEKEHKSDSKICIKEEEE